MNEPVPTIEQFKAYMLTQYPDLMKPYISGRIGPNSIFLVNWVQFHTHMIQEYNVLKYIGPENDAEKDGYEWCSMNTLMKWIWFHPNEFEMAIL